MGRIITWLGCAALLTATVLVSDASAQLGGFNGGFGYGSGYNYYGYNSGYNQHQLPYFALYPPVYYSYPVARPYGYSPFAYPAGTMTPEVEQPVEAAEYRNPYVPKSRDASSDTDRTAATAKTYYNPYVRQLRTASK